MKAIHISLQIMQFSVFFTLHSFYWNLPAVYKFDSSVFQAILHSGSLPTCIGVHFPIAELDNAICSSNLPGYSKGARVPVACIIPSGALGLIVFFKTSKELKCYHLVSIPTLSIWFWNLMKAEFKKKLFSET